MYPMLRVMIFIDAGYIRGLLSPFFFKDSEITINYPRLLEFLQMHMPDHSQVIRKYYYDGIVDPKDNSEEHNKMRSFNRFVSRYGFTIRLARLKQAREGQRQKGVDVLIAIDMLSKAYKDHYDIAYLLTGDDDFLDVVNAVKNEAGKRVYGIFSENSISQDLREAFDQRYIISQEDLKKLAEKIIS